MSCGFSNNLTAQTCASASSLHSGNALHGTLALLYSLFFWVATSTALLRVESWWEGPAGTYNFMFGYFNRNAKEEVDIPIGPDNHIDPAGDYGQPTHFYTRRHWGVYVLTLPKDVALGAKKPAWTLSVHGVKSVIPVSTEPIYVLHPFSDTGTGNTPPTISLDEKGLSVQGPKAVIVSRTANVATPLPITVWAADDERSLRPGTPAAGAGGAAAKAGPPPATGVGPPVGAGAARPIGPVGVIFEKLRGPGEVTFANDKPPVERIENGDIPIKEKFNGKTSTTAMFSTPGEYVLRIYSIDVSGEGGNGFLCCWINIYMRVNVTK